MLKINRSEITYRQFMNELYRRADPALNIAQADKKFKDLPALPRYESLQYDFALTHASMLGFYPQFYVCKDGSCLCADCANKQDRKDRAGIADPDYWRTSAETIIHADINFEDPDLYCDACNKRIESAYAEAD